MNNSHKSNISIKKKSINDCKNRIKNELIGLDESVDKILDSITTWYMYGNINNKPTIINLWGPTGVGKTEIIRKISNSLQVPLSEIDGGEFTSELKFSTILRNNFSHLSGSKCILCVDEFQNIKSLTRRGDEIERNYTRGIWKLMSDGLVEIGTQDIDSVFSDLKRCKKSYMKWKKRKDRLKEPKEENSSKKEEEDDDDDYEYYYEGYYFNTFFESEYSGNLLGDTSTFAICQVQRITPFELNNRLYTNFLQTIDKLINDFNYVDYSNICLDFRNSLIFIVGNIDNLFHSYQTMNPDLSPDLLHTMSSKVTIPYVKEVLSDYFKPEQISRMGNNHIVFPYLNEKSFRKIIKIYVEDVLAHFKDKLKIQFECDDSIFDIVYDEGVFPTQGVRPLFSTIQNIVEFSCQKFVNALIYNDKLSNRTIRVKMKYNKSNENVEFKYGKSLFSFATTLSVSKLRKPVFDDKHSIVAIHESGHALSHILYYRCPPRKVTAFTADGYTLGANFTEETEDLISKSQIYNEIVYMLGGYAAELHFFGDENVTTGASGDLSQATKMAVRYVEKFGFNNGDIVCASRDNPDYPERSNAKEQNIELLLFSALQTAKSNVSKYEKIIVDLSSNLLMKESLTNTDILEIIGKYEIEELKDSKFSYKKSVMSKIKEHNLKVPSDN